MISCVNVPEVINTLNNDGIVVIRTDTLYGIIARAASKKAVERVYTVKRRELDKQCIVLIANPEDAPAYGELIEQHSLDQRLPTSVVVPASDEPSWVLRGGDSVAYRIVKNEDLRKIIMAVGPIIAPSANPEGKPPARNISEAQDYFGDDIDLYVDNGEVPRAARASQIIRVGKDGSIDQLR